MKHDPVGAIPKLTSAECFGFIRAVLVGLPRWPGFVKPPRLGSAFRQTYIEMAGKLRTVCEAVAHLAPQALPGVPRVLAGCAVDLLTSFAICLGCLYLAIVWACQIAYRWVRALLPRLRRHMRSREFADDVRAFAVLHFGIASLLSITVCIAGAFTT